MDISLYKGEDQLDKIEKKRSKSSSTGKSKNDDEASDEKTKSEEPIANDKSNPDTKKGRGRPKENKSEPSKPAKEDTGGKREKRKASKNMSYEAYDFLEEEDDEVMPAPKKRKSQDSITEPVETKVEDKKAGKAEKTDSKASDDAPKKDAEPLSTSERALLADKEKDKDKDAPAPASAAAGTDLPDEEAEDDSQQPVKKRGRKPKAKE